MLRYLSIRKRRKTNSILDFLSSNWPNFVSEDVSGHHAAVFTNSPASVSGYYSHLFIRKPHKSPRVQAEQLENIIVKLRMIQFHPNQ